jgi:mannonate dehydratase
MVSRRRFIRAAAVTTLGAVGLSKTSLAGDTGNLTGKTAESKKPQMHVGTQGSSTDKMLQFYKRCGVDNVCGEPSDRWTVDGLVQLKQQCESYGITLDMVPLGMPTSVGLVGDKGYRDRQIEQTCEQIRMAAKTSIGAIKYNLSVLGALRTGNSLGRGGSMYNVWAYQSALKSLPEVAQLPADVFWERITYFLERVIPVAIEYKVKMACHPHDPGVPEPGYRGEARVLGTVEGLKKFIEISPSPYHGLNFCAGTIASNLYNPAGEIFDVIRYFGQRKKIFNVHLRNIRGRRDNFQEVYHDEGDIDLYKVVKVLKEVGYSGMVMPDHVPTHPDDPDQFQGFAFGFGYIKALIQSVYAES